MYRKDITYRDYEGNLSTDTLWFAMNEVELMDMENDMKKKYGDVVDEKRAKEESYLVAYLEHVKKNDDGAAATDFIKDLIKRAYGVKSADGKRFVKSDEAYTEFTQTAVYPAFFMLLATNTDEAQAFMTGITPQDIREQAEKMSAVDRAKQAANISALPHPESAGGPIPVVEPIRTEHETYVAGGPVYYNN